MGGQESLKNLNKHFLDAKYSVYCEASNSDRGIDLGILVPQHLEHPYTLYLHRHSVFARGVYQLDMDIDQQRYTFLLTHLKSKLSKGDDFEGRAQRAEEVQQLNQIFQDCSQNEKNPVFICGDLNATYGPDNHEPELEILANKSGLIDAFEVLKKPIFDRATYLYYNTAGEVHLMQLDYFLVSSRWGHLIDQSSSVLDFHGGTRQTLPADFGQKLLQPSDHYPLCIVLNI